MMKISKQPQPEKTAARKARLQDAGTQKAARRRQPPATPTIDRVRLSPRAQEYQKARKALAALPDVDADKVQAVHDRLRSGGYRIEADKIAAEMIRDVLAGDE
jgi:flagellar biosynthesis anti-sigma factor FlgM